MVPDQQMGKFLRIQLALLGLGLCHGAIAQEQEGISLGQFRLLPTIGLTWGHDDNVTYANDRLNDPVSSDFYVISPGIRLEAPSDRSITTLTWQGEIGRYDDSPVDDYETWSLRGSWDFDPSHRTSMGLFAELRDGRDRRGEGRSQGNLGLEQLAPDEYEMFSYGGRFSYGAIGARGRIEVELGRNELEYQNNRQFTEFLDRDDDHIEATFFVRIRPKTSLLLSVGHTDVDYRRTIMNQASLDSSEDRYGIGLQWDVTARTSGRIEFGKLEKDFDDPSQEGYDGEYWTAGVSWQPRSYSTFNLIASRETDESRGFGNFVLREDISLDWTHFWTTRFNTVLEYGVGTDDYRPGVREDDFTYWGVEARWQLNQYFQVGVGFHDYERDSNDSEFNYMRDVWMITLEASL